jgi:hypothetical protein
LNSADAAAARLTDGVALTRDMAGGQVAGDL